ncbi:hypothetical protein PsorP6_010263 [Peronosclerospora sorghi]|uniref:Uncharacterized protein n=1 Tax=Peronosclerospora sorghi TaxID=230839 RepID=A0ACC0VXD1_9STRA|nr:hypothetical protein PsorP6_010263 [Peronosclerospora sorghi]
MVNLSLCTVLDYYLDNVIANIPELAICMHLKGFVRGYKLVETRQIPYISATGRPLFDVQDVSMNASMLLKFRQEICLRQNGTYWLHRKEGETSLRLYDVDVLSRGSQLKWKYMMEMLCYRFAARDSRLSTLVASGAPQLRKQLQQRKRDLLRTCMSLLGDIAQKGGAAHSSICSSDSEQLADTCLRECHQLHSFNSATTSSADSDRDAAIRSLEKAKQYLLASINCLNDSSSALTCSDDVATNIAPMDADEDGEMGSFMDEELNRLQLKFSSACLNLGHIYARNHMWIEALNACQFLSASSLPDDVWPLDLSSQDNLVDLILDKLDFDGVGRDRLSQETILICVSGAELRCCLLGSLGDVAGPKPASVYDELAALYDILSGIKAEFLSSVCENASDFLNACTKHAEVTESKIYANREEDLLSLSFLDYLRGLLPPVNSELYLYVRLTY